MDVKMFYIFFSLLVPLLLCWNKTEHICLFYKEKSLKPGAVAEWIRRLTTVWEMRVRIPPGALFQNVGKGGGGGGGSAKVGLGMLQS